MFIIFCCPLEWYCICSCCRAGFLEAALGRRIALGSVSRPWCRPFLSALTVRPKCLMSPLLLPLTGNPGKQCILNTRSNDPQNTPRATLWAPSRADPCGTAGQYRLLQAWMDLNGETLSVQKPHLVQLGRKLPCTPWKSSHSKFFPAQNPVFRQQGLCKHNWCNKCRQGEDTQCHARTFSWILVHTTRSCSTNAATHSIWNGWHPCCDMERHTDRPVI